MLIKIDSEVVIAASLLWVNLIFFTKILDTHRLALYQIINDNWQIENMECPSLKYLINFLFCIFYYTWQYNSPNSNSSFCMFHCSIQDTYLLNTSSRMRIHAMYW